MDIQDERIDAGKAFDWGRTAGDYARFRDIYPNLFYEKIAERHLCVKGQTVLDLGTGTGVLPRNMARYGAEWTGTDIAPEQIAQAQRLAGEAHQKIRFLTMATEELDFPDNTFDVITACQCFWYFDHEKIMPKLARMLKKDGRLLLLYMAWLPYEDAVAGASEALVLKYSPSWSGAGETEHPIQVPGCVYEAFDPVYHEEYRLDVPFTRETWNGRMKACRGVGASLSAHELARWETEHRSLLERMAPPAFCVKHYAAMLELKRK